MSSASSLPSVLIHHSVLTPVRDTYLNIDQPSSTLSSTDGYTPASNRLCALSSSVSILSRLNHVELVIPLRPTQPLIERGRQGPNISAPISMKVEQLKVHANKHHQNVTHVMGRTQTSKQTDKQTTHHTESQSKSTVEKDILLPFLEAPESYVIGSVDSAGYGCISCIDLSSAYSPASSTYSSTTSELTTEHSWELVPAEPLEDGWHGLALHPFEHTQANVISYWNRKSFFYSADRLVSTIKLQAAPLSSRYLVVPASSHPLLAINEGNVTSIWDDRTPDIPVQRMSDQPHDLYALDTHPSGLLATGGVDKQVTVYDCRRWAVSGRWRNVLKYELISLRFSHTSPHSIYVTGLDHELYCGEWGSVTGGLHALQGGGPMGSTEGGGVARDLNNNAIDNPSQLRRNGFRGDSRWMGIDRCGDCDDVMGFTETGQFYYIASARNLSHNLAQLSLSSSSSSSTTSMNDVDTQVSQAAQDDRQRRRELAMKKREEAMQLLKEMRQEEGGELDDGQKLSKKEKKEIKKIMNKRKREEETQQ